MALRAVRFSTIAHTAKATPLVLGVRDYLKVRWINTRSVTTKMVELHSIRDGAYQPLVAKAMRLLEYVTRHLEMPITIASVGSPNPAGIRLLNLRPETNLRWNRVVAIWHGYHRITSGEAVLNT